MKSVRRFGRLAAVTLALGLALSAATITTRAQGAITILNVSYDPTRELYREFNAAFEKALEREDWTDGDDSRLARRIGQPGTSGHRRS